MEEPSSEKSFEKVNKQSALRILSQEGPLASRLKGFEARTEQMQMMGNVLDAYNHNSIALIEAGTGTGKSMAYLIPALLWAAQTKERTVISTNTITLQEQLLHKDIPLLEKTLGLNLKVVLVKGMSNYLCMRKHDEAMQEILLLPKHEAEELQRIEMWREGKHDGTRSSMPFSPSSAIWDKVAAENDTCNRNKCPYYADCHFFKARKQASEAHILIANHHLLFADLACREEAEIGKENAILPSYNRVILDEAHNIEDIATEYFASNVSQLDLLRQLGRLTAEKGGKVQGKLPLLKEKLTQYFKNDLSQKTSAIFQTLIIELPGMREDVLLHIQNAFGAFTEFATLLKNGERSAEESGLENKLRILPLHQTHPFWNEQIVPRSLEICECLKRYAQALIALSTDIKQLKDSNLDEQVKGTLFEIEALANRLITYSFAIESFIAAPTTTKVRWIEQQTLKTMVNTSLVNADLDVSKLLANFLFSKFSTVVLCSATLTTDQHFSFIRNRLGLTPHLLPHHKVSEAIYASPFNYSQQALFVIPNDLPNPSDHSFLNVAIERIWQTIVSSRGNAFILFTSYSMLRACYEKLEERLRANRFHPLKQGDEDRHTLLKRFKSTDYSVLFGTDSFWEGVDVAGDALRCVVIVKLPFKVPTEPLFQARSEAILARGGDAFSEYSLPQAIVKFKQGFGRLIRHKRDRGCIVCLDNRIMTKKYGQKFLSSLPKCQEAFVPSTSFSQQMTDFYKKTHHLVIK